MEGLQELLGLVNLVLWTNENVVVFKSRLELLFLRVECILNNEDAEASWHAGNGFFSGISLQMLSRKFIEQFDSSIDVSVGAAFGLFAFFCIIVATSWGASLTSDLLTCKKVVEVFDKI